MTEHRKHYAKWLACAVEKITEAAVEQGLMSFEINVRPDGFANALVTSLYVRSFASEKVFSISCATTIGLLLHVNFETHFEHLAMEMVGKAQKQLEEEYREDLI